ncbi:MAG: DUF3352 domain-containing protein [Candidatus Dormibacteraeota bacterium]|nr:DUF3352 domain-containing protein [Candidatus Dormibacteraeota bacterium]
MITNPGGQTPLLAVPAGASWLRRHRLQLAATGAALAIGAVSASAALLLLAKPVNTVESMVPATSDVLVLANLDPSVAQKVNLARSLHRFPSTKDDRAISDAIDNALQGTGLSYSSDLKPWLGGELGLSARVNVDSTTDSSGVVYAVSRDDVKAKAFLSKLRTVGVGKTMQWRDESYSGFTIASGTPNRSTDKPAAYSYVNHIALIATSSATIKEAIDTLQGRGARLIDSTNYTTTVAGLPSDRLGLVYVNGTSIVAGIRKQLARATTASTPIMGNIKDLDAFVGIGAALSAADNGIAADLLVKFDQSKLSPATRQALASAGRPDAILTWVPRGSEAVVAVGNLNRTVQTLVDASKSDPSIVASSNAFGLTGPGGILPHLTGGAALEAQVGSGVSPSGAILLATDDAASLRTFFGKLLTSASSVGTALIPGSTGSQKPPSTPAVRTATYRGTVITSLSVPQSGLALLAPSYAVLDGVGIFGSNLASVTAVIDAHKGAETIAADPSYKAAIASSLRKPSLVAYVNVSSLIAGVRRLAASSAVPDKTLTAVAPIKAVMLTATSQSDQATERFFLVIN